MSFPLSGEKLVRGAMGNCTNVDTKVTDISRNICNKMLRKLRAGVLGISRR